MELRTLLRDRRTVVLAVVLPLVVMPLVLFASRWAETLRAGVLDSRPAVYAVAGPRADDVKALLRAIQGGDPAATSPSRTAGVRWTERAASEPASALEAGLIDVYLEGADAAAVERARATDRAGSGPYPQRVRESGPDGASGRADADFTSTLDLDDPGQPPAADLLAVTIAFRSDREASRRAAEQIADRLQTYRRWERHRALAAQGFPVGPETVAAWDVHDVAAPSQVAGLALGRFLTALLLFLVMTGGAVVAQDTLAGEKERGTLETLLTSAITPREIVLAKVLLVLAVGLGITAVQVVNLLVYVGFGLIPSSQALGATTPGLAAGLFVFLLPLAGLAAGVLVLASGFARSYREAQLYLLPLLLLGALPALAAALPDVSLRSAVVLVPIANISVGVKELLVGRADWLALPVAWTVTAATAVATLVLAARALRTERLIVPTLGDAPPAAGSAPRPGQLVAWFGVMWAIVLVVSVNAGPEFDIRGQLLINLVVVFLGGALLFLKRFRLDAGDTLLLRRPHPAAWLAVALGVPGGIVTSIGIFRLSQLVFPVPRETLESFGQYLLPAQVPLWQLVPMTTALPAICEEVAFRGVLLQTLRRHVSPTAAVLVVGLVFGLFHFSLFRILPTAYLGVLLAAVTLASGSLYPAIAWHALNNLLGLTAGHLALPLDRVPWWGVAAGTVALAASLWTLVRTGLPMSRPLRAARPPRTLASGT
jgi:ABC-type Na+ efflux pump permease subunit/membrane protease YdiL (CAAX protease family)